MGISWLTEIISFAVGGDASHWFFTDILNVLTGVFIFLIFVCKPNVWKRLKMHYPCLERLDVCCPAYMKGKGLAGSQHGQSTRVESNSLSASGKYYHQTHPEAHRMASVTASIAQQQKSSGHKV